ncbi:MAG TPA: VOC family protein [Sphingobium sp.]
MHIPPGFTQLFPYIFAEDAKAYLAFLADGLGGEITSAYEAPPGILANAHVRFGDTTLMVSEATEANPQTRGTYYLYVEDADAAMACGIAAGGVEIGKVCDQAYGDRQGGLRDPWSNIWWLSQRLAAGGYG